MGVTFDVYSTLEHCMIADHKHSIALEHLRSAILIYKNGDAFHSALHLAGAAEEILGMLVKHKTNYKNAPEEQIDFEKEISPLFNDTTPSEAQIKSKILRPKNYTKHFKNLEEPAHDFDAKREARNFLLAAIDNLNKLELEPGDDINEFEDLLHHEDIEEIEAALQHFQAKE